MDGRPLGRLFAALWQLHRDSALWHCTAPLLCHTRAVQGFQGLLRPSRNPQPCSWEPAKPTCPPTPPAQLPGGCWAANPLPHALALCTKERDVHSDAQAAFVEDISYAGFRRCGYRRGHAAGPQPHLGTGQLPPRHSLQQVLQTHHQQGLRSRDLLHHGTRREEAHDRQRLFNAVVSVILAEAWGHGWVGHG